MSLVDEARIKQVEEELRQERAAKEQALRKSRQLADALKLTTAERDSFRATADFAEGLKRAKLTAPKWMTAPRKAGKRRGIANALLTDTHFDEVVNPPEVDGYNAYNRQIAESRLQGWAQQVVEKAADAGFEYEGAVISVGGDIFSGNIHDELRETNETTLLSSVVHWAEQLEAAFGLILEGLGVPLHVPCTYGNHGRSTRKPRAKRRAQDNIEYLLYHMLARSFRDEQRITFDIPDAADTHFTEYSTRYLLTHGDQFRGGSGISGMMAPLMLGQHRKTRREMAAGRGFDWLVIGHWHQLWFGKGIIVGGTLKGQDEFSYVSNFEPEPASQAFWITTPNHGMALSAPIYVQDQAAEGW